MEKLNEKDIKWIVKYLHIDESEVDDRAIKIVKNTLAFQLYKTNEAWDDCINEVKKEYTKSPKFYIWFGIVLYVLITIIVNIIR